jgi:tetratricopeptide (TPR) repeat protein
VAARAAFRQPDALGLSAEEAQLIERLAQPAAVEKLLADGGAPRVDTLRRLAQLKVTGRIRTLGKDGSGPRTLPPYVAGDAELAQRLHQRFAQRLRDEPVALSAEQYRKRIGELFARIGGLGAYEVLEVEPGASTEAIEAKFERLAMLVHPENESKFGLQGIRPILELLLERATQAYLTLADPDRRLRYDESEGIAPGSSAPTGARREEEQRTVARRYFEEGLGMAARGDYHFAIEMLELASTTDPRAEYFLALARAQSKNPKWTARAIASCRSALELDSQNAEARLQLGQLLEAEGDTARARVQYGAVARESPHHGQAQARLRALDEQAPARPKSGGGLFDRLFGRRD